MKERILSGVCAKHLHSFKGWGTNEWPSLIQRSAFVASSRVRWEKNIVNIYDILYLYWRYCVGIVTDCFERVNLWFETIFSEKRIAIDIFERACGVVSVIPFYLFINLLILLSYTWYFVKYTIHKNIYKYLYIVCQRSNWRHCFRSIFAILHKMFFFQTLICCLCQLFNLKTLINK